MQQNRQRLLRGDCPGLPPRCAPEWPEVQTEVPHRRCPPGQLASVLHGTFVV